ncbi:hypothetical protein [uncultured Murdochiella sp.]|uniref:hypothetical protein n=1 Tax=uncultured Murdochiella sp. TaxID=1586095 RepID=UPI0028065B13|nr:hypothetical protein [uncultured Murdochiella sp.]
MIPFLAVHLDVVRRWMQCWRRGFMWCAAGRNVGGAVRCGAPLGRRWRRVFMRI